MLRLRDSVGKSGGHGHHGGLLRWAEAFEAGGDQRARRPSSVTSIIRSVRNGKFLAAQKPEHGDAGEAPRAAPSGRRAWLVASPASCAIIIPTIRPRRRLRTSAREPPRQHYNVIMGVRAHGQPSPGRRGSYGARGQQIVRPSAHCRAGRRGLS